MEDVKEVWKAGNFEPPRLVEVTVFTPLNEEWIGNKLLVIEEGTILTLMDKGGNVYYISSQRCKRTKKGVICIGPLYYAPFPEDSKRVQYARREIIPNYL